MSRLLSRTTASSLSRRFPILLALLFPLFVAAAGAVSFSFNPIVYSRVDTKPEPTAERYALWPFFSSESTTLSSVEGLHPLWSWTVDHQKPMSNLDILWPLLSWRTAYDPPAKETLHRQMILPLWYGKKTDSPQDGVAERQVLFPFYTYGRRALPGAPETSHRVIFPFWWRFNNQNIMFPFYWNKPADSFAFWPMYGRFLNLFGYDRIEFILWPLWVTSQAGDAHSYSPLWPIFNYTTGKGVRGGRLWPLGGYYSSEKSGPRGFYLWPLGQYAKFEQGALRDAKLNMFLPFWFLLDHPKRQLGYYFPFYGYDHSANRDSRAYLWPVYSRTISTKPVYRKDSVMWLLWSRKSGPDIVDWKAFIFAGKKKEPGSENAYILWPIGLYNRKREDVGHYDRVSKFVVPLYFSMQRRHDNGRVESSSLLWPLAFWRQDGNRHEFSMLRFFWYNNSDAIDRNWAPLWTFYSSLNDPDRGVRARRVAGPLYWTLKDRKQDRSEFNLLFFQYRREGIEKRVSLLGGLLPWRISGEAAGSTAKP